MSGKVQELGIKNEVGFFLNDDAFKIIIPVLPGHTVNLPVCFTVSIEKELQRRAGVEPYQEISRIDKDEDKNIYLSEGERCLHPVDLCLFSGQKF